MYIYVFHLTLINTYVPIPHFKPEVDKSVLLTYIVSNNERTHFYVNVFLVCDTKKLQPSIPFFIFCWQFLIHLFSTIVYTYGFLLLCIQVLMLNIGILYPSEA